MELVTQPPGAAADAPRLPRVRLTRYLRARELRAAAARGSEAAAALRALLLGEAAEEGGWDAPARRPPGGRPAIALLTASGNIVSGKGSGREVAQNQQIASTPFCRALAAARDDPAIAAVVVRLDSQGGSAIASDTIAREMQRTRQAKPVVVSMARPAPPAAPRAPGGPGPTAAAARAQGNVAASGGYYISAPATKIVAQPSTLTGSIGVVRSARGGRPASPPRPGRCASMPQGSSACVSCPYPAGGTSRHRNDNPLARRRSGGRRGGLTRGAPAPGVWQVQRRAGAARPGRQPGDDRGGRQRGRHAAVRRLHRQPEAHHRRHRRQRVQRLPAQRARPALP